MIQAIILTAFKLELPLPTKLWALHMFISNYWDGGGAQHTKNISGYQLWFSRNCHNSWCPGPHQGITSPHLHLKETVSVCRGFYHWICKTKNYYLYSVFIGVWSSKKALCKTYITHYVAMYMCNYIIYIYIYIYIYTHVYIYVLYMCRCIYVCMYVYMFVCKYV